MQASPPVLTFLIRTPGTAHKPAVNSNYLKLLKQFTCRAHVLFYTRSIRDAVHSGRRTPCNPAPASSRTSDTPHNMTRKAFFCFLSASRADSFHNPYSFHIDRSFSPAWVNSFVLMRNFFPLFFELCFQLIESVGNYGQKFVHRLELLLDGFQQWMQIFARRLRFVGGARPRYQLGGSYPHPLGYQLYGI